MSTPPLSPRERYQRDLAKPGFVSDPAQAEAVNALDTVYRNLVQRPPYKRFLSQRLHWPLVQGLYLWGGVGRGKTYLMDTFYESLPFPYKLRTHFHRFMLDVHARRQHYADQRDPLKLVALEHAHRVRVLCFDEFYVSDIADAMILGRLTEELINEGVTLVATSNCAPDELYRNGLQRQNFLPAITRLKQSLRILNVDGGVDYRLRQLTRLPLFLHPDDAQAQQAMERNFREVAGAAGEHDASLDILGRHVKVRRLAHNAAWFDFNELCQGPRGAADYIELARLFPHVLISRLPQLDFTNEDAARRFINLVDEFYDRGVKLLIAATVPMDEIYAGKRLGFEFRRTLSRLQEMQSQEYLARPHLP